MAIWNRRKKYTMESDSSNKKRSKIQLQLSKLVKREMYVTMLSIVAVTVIILGSTYAVFSSVNKSADYNVINVGTLEVSYEDTGDGLGDVIRLNNAFPVSDTEGMSSTGYKFKITNIGSLVTKYTVKVALDQAMVDADDCETNLLNFNTLRYSLNNGSATDLSSSVDSQGNYVIDVGQLTSGESRKFDLKMWIKSTAGNEVLGKHFHGKIVVEMITNDVQSTPIECFVTSENSDGTLNIDYYQCGPTIYSGHIIDGTSTTYPNVYYETNDIVDVIIPSAIDGKSITTIGQSAFTYTGIESVIIPEGITTIRSSFLNNNLTTVTIPSSVTTIDYYAFSYGNQLTSVIIKGKTSPADFAVYNSPFHTAWATECSGYEDNINPCIRWEG